MVASFHPYSTKLVLKGCFHLGNLTFMQALTAENLRKVSLLIPFKFNSAEQNFFSACLNKTSANDP